ncbi:hypothetical protein QBC34DRAFT_389617 [Podospora aff. communis PSN243]|uniref:Uncharacterized protein n=1 Tax=Podospora aff. communis PSN243 TaxID=3040156 RepID=A0AAV9H792_9PEZI|nr:hypothetical protein QBC34DRAFT_389617 [Podospora aff. communis PSN243]
MEVQNKDAPQTHSPLDDQEAIPQYPVISTSTSVPSLRFPRPQGNARLANWISNSSPDILQLQPPNMSESSSLADSAFEIINSPDSESQDGRMSESTSSLDISRPDDVHSLDGSEHHYDTDTDEESDHSSHASPIRYADEALQNPSTQTPPHAIPYSSPSSEGSGVMLASIEFREECDEQSLDMDKISAKHVIEEFDEEASTIVAKHLSLPVSPRILVATARQSMSRASLSVKDPLRVLYTGRPEVKRDVIIKISNAIWASPQNGSSDEDPFLRHNDGVYNIVPISSFGPNPELDLMEASQYQIKVEHCTLASESSVGDDQSSSPMYTINVGGDRDKTYSTIVTPKGVTTQPQWALPHIAVFYCADDEDKTDKDTREAAWKFMRGHSIPCIFITESPVLEKPITTKWGDYIDENVLHLSIESRDQEREIPPQRLPIDFWSFINIDARQMNRNLAYLTGMTEVEQKPLAATIEDKQLSWEAGIQKAWDQRPSRDQVLQSIEQNKWFIAMLVPILMTLVAPLLSALFTSLPTGRDFSTHQVPVAGIHGLPSTGSSRVSTTSTTSIATSTSTTTVVINVTSTKTVQLSRALPSTSSLASVLPFAGFLSDRPSDTPTEPEVKKTACSVRVYNPHELLITLPYGSKAGWLARGAIDIDVSRGDEHLKSKLSSVDEGIIVELSQKDAYGILNVSVVTTRRPKINETFEVDFGTTLMGEAIEIFQGVTKAVFSTVDEAAHAIEKAQLSGMAKIRGEAASVWVQATGAGRKYEETLTRVKDSFDSNYQRVMEAVTHQLKPTKRLHAEADLSLLGAQVRAKLWWLKVQGKDKEFAEYQRNASQLLKKKYEEMMEAYHADDTARTQQSAVKCGKFGKGRCTGDITQEESKDYRWKKMILG